MRRDYDELAAKFDAYQGNGSAREGETYANDTEATKAKYGGGQFELRGNGVYFLEKQNDKDVEVWICSPLQVTAKTRNDHSNAWGRLLVWRDDDDKQHQWAMPSELLQGDGSDVRKELAAGGLHISPGRRARELLTAYIQVRPVKDRARCVNRLGWHTNSYVTTGKVFGLAAEKLVFQCDSALEPATDASGTYEDWRDNVARLAQGNSRLTFCICTAFGAPLLDVVGEESGGFHLRGSSSMGKTKTLLAAASVYGPPDRYKRTWRATANGLEGVAAIHNDGLLVLDEMHQCDPREVGEVVYMLANGMGKARASRTGAARRAMTWRLWILSSGEQSLAARLGAIGRQSTSGQEVRLAEIPVDADMGVVEDLHGFASSAAFIESLAVAYQRYYGAVGREWLRRIVADRIEVAAVLGENMERFTTSLLEGSDAGGQVRRVARRFALAAIAGDLATRYGLTGWPEGEAEKAARTCFSAWLKVYGGTGNRDERALLMQVRGFLEAHGSSRFEPYNGSPEDGHRPVNNRVGFTRPDGSGGVQYLVLPEVFRTELVRGFDHRWAAQVLARHNWLGTQDARTTCNERIPALKAGTTRVYVLTDKALGDDQESAR
jgi:uncharacterized protein (DUF927 family)